MDDKTKALYIYLISNPNFASLIAELGYKITVNCAADNFIHDFALKSNFFRLKHKNAVTELLRKGE